MIWRQAVIISCVIIQSGTGLSWCELTVSGGPLWLRQSRDNLDHEMLDRPGLLPLYWTTVMMVSGFRQQDWILITSSSSSSISQAKPNFQYLHHTRNILGIFLTFILLCRHPSSDNISSSSKLPGMEWGKYFAKILNIYYNCPLWLKPFQILTISKDRICFKYFVNFKIKDNIIIITI